MRAISAARIVRRVRRWMPLLFYAMLAVAILWPYRSARLPKVGDLPTVVLLTEEAARALHEGQFPIRVTPDFSDGHRLPLFQLYAVLPYTLTGALHASGIMNGYQAWKLVMFLSFLSGGYFSFRLARAFRCGYGASLLSGATFLTAPYLLTDLNSRGAFAELVAINLLPMAFYFSLRCLRSRRIRYVACCALSWGMIAFSHNITYLYGVGFAAAFFLIVGGGPGCVRRLSRLGAAGVIHASLVLWHILPQLQTMNLLSIGDTNTPYTWSALTPWWILLSPVSANTEMGQSSPGLGLQVGWPILIFWLLALGWLMMRGRMADLRVRPAVASLVLASLAFFIAWSPSNFWRFLPSVLWFVQFPYRMLMFVVLFGSMLAGLVLHWLFPRGVGRWPALVCVTGLLVCASTHWVPSRDIETTDVAVAESNTNSSLYGCYFVAPKILAKTNWTDADPHNKDWALRCKQLADSARSDDVALGHNLLPVRGGIESCYTADRNLILELPVVYYPQGLQVWDRNQAISYGNAGCFVAVRLGPGEHHLRLAYVGSPWANIVGMAAWIGLGIGALWAGIRFATRRLKQINQF